jgi:hypothetical protein
MSDRMVYVPVSRLLDPTMTAATKVIWMALCLQPKATPRELQAQTGLSRPTVEHGLAQLAVSKGTPGGPKAKVPGPLLADRTVGPQAKALFGLLQTTPNFKGQAGQFTFTSLSALTRLGPNTLKRAMAELAGAGWVELAQESRVSPIVFTLGPRELRRSQQEAAVARRRLKRAQNGGEAIMQEYLSLLIDSNQFTDNARPGFLVNPQTGERLELDRLYLPNLAFEFNGAQHYGQTERFTQAEADAQRLRDLIKAGICLYQGVHLVIIHGEDLSVQGMTKRIGQAMPLRSLAGQEPLIEVLEEASLLYRAAAGEGGRAPHRQENVT